MRPRLDCIVLRLRGSWGLSEARWRSRTNGTASVDLFLPRLQSISACSIRDQAAPRRVNVPSIRLVPRCAGGRL